MPIALELKVDVCTTFGKPDMVALLTRPLQGGFNFILPNQNDNFTNRINDYFRRFDLGTSG